MTASLGTILVVDDEELNRDMLGRRLEIEGFTVALASGGREALRSLAERPFDAVLLDVMMPIQNGYEVLREIRKSYSPVELPVLMVTAKSQSDDMVAAFEHGANDYLTKPIDFPVALARINCHLGSKRLSSKLRDSEARYALSAQGSNDGLWDWDLVSDEVHYSPRWKSMLGYDATEIGVTPDDWFSRIHPDDLPHVKAAIAAHRTGKSDRFECEYRMMNKDRTYTWVLSRGVAIRDAQGRETRMAGSQTDITRGKAADPLTGLANRVLFMDHLSAAVRKSREIPAHHAAVLFIDLDRFKLINDSLGHHAGDNLLKAVARRLESCVRTSDVVTRLADRCTVARFGGDEFVILLNGLQSPENSAQIADRVLRCLSESMELQGHNVAVSASIGIAVATDQDQSGEDLLRDADTAMYEAKAAGKSRWTVFEPRMRQRAIERLELENELRRGIAHEEFVVYYQPIVSINSSLIEGFEALLRWQHPVRGLVSPLEFIPIAEETGLIMELGAWVLKQSCLQLKRWQDEYPGHDYFMSVNVSGKQFSDPKLAERVAACIGECGISPSSLKIEITETAIMSDPELAAKTLEALRETGVSLSLDDFGTGHSSLSYLQQFPINTLKIDRSFIQRMGDSREAQEIVRTIITLAHSLGMEVTAEGIEHQEQHMQLRAIDCKAGQGYLYSRPLPAQAIGEVLREQGHDDATQHASRPEETALIY